MTFDEIFEQVDKVEGWMGEADCRTLYYYTKDIKGLIVEIGCYMGRSTKLLSLSSPKSKIITIDPLEDNAFSIHSRGIVRESADNVIRGSNITLIMKKSQVVGKKWKEPIDFLHIDGDHLYEAVKSDIKLFVPHVKKGRYVFFHDYNLKDPGEEYLPNKHGVWKALVEFKDYFDDISTSVDYGFAICRKK